MKALRVGLTGGLAAGKSTVSGWLREAGFLVFDADQLVAEIYRPGGEGAAAVSRLFGPSYLNADGAVDRERLAQRIFEDPEARASLESAIHPLVRQRFETLAADQEGVVVLEATLLVEAGFAPHFDLVVTVEAEAETRARRAAGRGLDRASARRRMAAQGVETTRVAAAHRVLRNDGSLSNLRTQVDALIEDLRKRSNRDW